MTTELITTNQLAELNRSIELLNGPASFSTDQETYGFLRDEEKLVLHTGFVIGRDYALRRNQVITNYDTSAGNLNRLTLLNDHRQLVIPSNVNTLTARDWLIVLTVLNIPAFAGKPDAALYALFRAILCVKGVITQMPAEGKRENFTNNNRCVYVDEVRRVDVLPEASNPLWRDAVTAMFSEQGKTILRHWHVLCGISSIVFMTRGHHFVGEDAPLGIILSGSQSTKQGYYSYAELYRAIYSACFPGENLPFSDVKAFFRTAIHPFGVNAPWRVFNKYADERKIPPALALRRYPAPAGTAKVTTARAIVRMMLGSPLFFDLRDRLEYMTANLYALADVILYNPTVYHQNASLFNGRVKTEDEENRLADAIAEATSLAPLLVAYVRTECKTSPIEQQKTLLKPANDQAGLLSRLERLFSKLDSVIDTMPLAQAIALVFPTQGNAPLQIRRPAPRLPAVRPRREPESDDEDENDDDDQPPGSRTEAPPEQPPSSAEQSPRAEEQPGTSILNKANINNMINDYISSLSQEHRRNYRAIRDDVAYTVLNSQESRHLNALQLNDKVRVELDLAVKKFLRDNPNRTEGDNVS